MFNTAHEYINQCLASIVMQDLKDKIRVTIIDDCSTVSYLEIIETFSKLIDIQYIKLDKNVGVGKARQIGIESTNCKYLTFIDSDDCLYNQYSLSLLYEKITKLNCEFVSGKFIREYESNGTSLLPTLSSIPKNQTWVFSRLFSRDFLVEHNISFSDMRFNEDVCFMSTVLCCSTNNSYIDNTIYVQHCNMNSLTRSDDSEFKKDAKGIINFVKALTYAHENKRKLGIVLTDKSKEQACDGLSVCYWYFIECYNQNSNDDCERFLESMQEFYNMITDDFDGIIKSDLLKKSYFISMDSMGEISRKFVPQISFWDLMDDLETNKNEVKYDSNCKYQFG